MKEAMKIIKRLQNNDHYALLVGGCVRDMKMGLVPKDYDIVTSATPDEVEKLFINTIPVGKQFGVIIVNNNYEVATFRVDRYNPDNELSIMFLRKERYSLEDLIKLDSEKRDLTINAIYYDPISDKYYDPQGGMNDIEDSIIRFVGDPLERVTEDPIRLLRFHRFRARYPHMDHHWEDWDILEDKGHLLKNVSKERIFQETTKILLEFPTIMFGDFRGLMDHLSEVIPVLDKLGQIEQSPIHHPEGVLDVHLYETLRNLRKRTPETVWAALLHDIGKIEDTKEIDGKIVAHGHDKTGAVMTEDILRDLKCSNKFIEEVVYIVENHMKIKEVQKMRKSKVLRLIHNEYYENLKEVSCADSMGSKGELSWWNYLNDFEKNHKKVGESLPDPLVTGRDLIDNGLKPGPEFKVILKKAFDMQLEDKNLTKELILLDIL